ncbi:hypothetical protein ACFVUY_38035 [Kitasatospora sp. NPDC058063]|uniref:hypothetical protein n=1 Tax=unclassified Kitasatospora TaxID=2633591 RepID=UPI0036DD64C1
MPETKTTPTFTTIANNHGKALAYLAGRQPGDGIPTAPAELVQLARDAVDYLNNCRFWNEAEAMEDAANRLGYAQQAEGDAERAVLLRGADKALRAIAYDAACEVADALGEPRNF